jgi:hypothetical protein
LDAFAVLLDGFDIIENPNGSSAIPAIDIPSGTHVC